MINKLTESEALEYILNHDKQVNPDMLLNEFKKSGLPLESFILDVYPSTIENTGGNCMVTIATLDNGNIFTVTNEAVAIFNNIDDFFDYENIIFEGFLKQ